jgi:20S proteasome subunit beta 4
LQLIALIHIQLWSLKTVSCDKKLENFCVHSDDSAKFKNISSISDETKIHKISDNLLIGAVGDAGDTIQFVEYISKNILLYKMRNGYELSPKSAAYFTRKNLADYLRTRYAYNVNMLVAGYDKNEGSVLSYIDYIANTLSVDRGAHGYGGMFCGSILDRHHYPDITQDEAYEVMRKCAREIQTRLIISQPKFHVMVVDGNGVHKLPEITTENLKN